MRFFNYQKAVDFLMSNRESSGRFTLDDKSVAERYNTLMKQLGFPQDKHQTIHIAGTSGKGSTAYLIDAILRAHTKHTGMTQSPHVYDIRERIQINGQLISEKGFVYSLSKIKEASDQSELKLSYFETLMAMAFESFARVDLDYQIIETGSGGRLDPSNVFSREDKICVITRIGLDHTQSLGDTIEEIATEKAGIINTKNKVFALRQDSVINNILEERAQEVGASITWVDQHKDYQKTNDALAVAVCGYLAKKDDWRIDPNTVKTTFENVFMPGRYEKRHYRDRLVILDGAHNPQKLEAISNRLRRDGEYKASVILGMGSRYDLRTCIEMLKPIAKRIIATRYDARSQNIPSLPAPISDLKHLCEDMGIEFIGEKSSSDALKRAAKFSEPIIVTGSFYLIGEVDKIF